MIATLSGHSAAARRQWSDPRARARLLAGQLIAAERRRVDRLVRDHLHLLPLAGAYAARMTGLDEADMAQSAFFGLRRAAETFDPTKGAAFPTHAYWGMKAACQEERFRMRTTIRVPRRSKHPFPKVSSIDLEGEDGATLGSTIPDDTAEDPADVLDRTELLDSLAPALGTLDPRDALVVEMRFGIGSAQRPHKFTEIGDHLGISGTRVRDLFDRALGQLRDTLSSFEL